MSVAQGTDMRLRRASKADAPALRQLLHAAYAPLAAAGMNFTAATQDLELTEAHIAAREVYLAEREGELVATVTLRDRVDPAGARHLYINALAVRPDLRRQGLGAALLRFAEETARERGIASCGSTPPSP